MPKLASNVIHVYTFPRLLVQNESSNEQNWIFEIEQEYMMVIEESTRFVKERLTY